MKESLPWEELGNNPTQAKKLPINIITNTEKAVKAIIDMLEVAQDQSELEWKNHITNFFAKGEDIISHLYRTGTISQINQVDELRLKVMKELNIPTNTIHNKIRKLLQKNPNFENRLNLSLEEVIKNIDTTDIKTAIQNRWKTTDKKYFKFNIRTLVEYTTIIKTYFFQKYGMEFTEENVKKIQEK